MTKRSIASSVVFALLALSSNAQYCTLPTVNPAAFAATKFDYLIVGAGPAGLTLASRLTENSKIKVGVVEAGGVHMSDLNITVPGFSGKALGDPRYDWQYSTIPQQYGNNRSIPVYRGRMLGGSSAINGLAWGRPSAEELDAWDEINGGKSGWTFSDLLPYFIKSEQFQSQYESYFPGLDDPETSPNSRPDNGTSGAVKVSFNVWFTDIVKPYVQALNEAGIKTNADPRNGNTTGIWETLVSIDRDHGIRTEAGMSYCFAYTRPNLQVLTGALATKVLISGKGNSLKAGSLSFRVNGTDYNATVSKEVILSAGVVKSSQLLELSGIGDSSILKAHNISTLVDLPGVGANFQEHPYVPSEFQLEPSIITLDILNNVTVLQQQMSLYELNKTGILASTNPAIGFMPTNLIASTNATGALLAAYDRSPAQLVAMGVPLTPLSYMQYKIQRKWLERGDVVDFEMLNQARGTPVDGQMHFTLLGGLMRPVSRGSVHINSSDPTSSPVINPNFLAAEYDQQLAITVLKFHQSLAAQPALSSVITAQLTPASNLTSDADLLNYARNTFSAGAHVTGTVAMAPKSLGGVVDTQLRVYGVSGLRVADCSIFPTQLAVHPQAFVYALAEKLADILKAQH